MSAPDKPQYFADAKAFRAWLRTHHKRQPAVWVGFYKKGYERNDLSFHQALDEALCYGWIYGVLRRVDFFSYKVKFQPRSRRSSWSPSTIKRVKQLQRLGRLHKSGLEAFKRRDPKKSYTVLTGFTPAIKRQFQGHKKAWAFFLTQSASYQKYTAFWVMSAKRTETRERRLHELMRDSASGTKLKRILEAEAKYARKRPAYPEGQTPIEAAKNIGPVLGAELRSLGVETLENLRAIGWERAFTRLVEMYPDRVNLNAVCALAGAVEDTIWRRLEPQLKAEVRAFFRDFKASSLYL